MFRIFLLISVLGGLACSKPQKAKNEPKNVDNAATRYAEQLRGTKSNAQEAVDSMNQAIAESQKRYGEINE